MPDLALWFLVLAFKIILCVALVARVEARRMRGLEGNRISPPRCNQPRPKLSLPGQATVVHPGRRQFGAYVWIEPRMIDGPGETWATETRMDGSIGMVPAPLSHSSFILPPSSFRTSFRYARPAALTPPIP